MDNQSDPNAPCRELPKYQSHKMVWALKIKDITDPNAATDGSRMIVPEDEGFAPFGVDGAYMRKHEPQIGGYYVQYKDGYKSYSPAQAFEDGYSRVYGTGKQMSFFKKKPVVIEATQWFKNGDHPGDACVLIPRSSMNDTVDTSEGKIIRYYRRPDDFGERSCERCQQIMHVHGWIDTLEGGHVVCPGDWIITGVKGERYPCKPDIFLATYDKVCDICKSEIQHQAGSCLPNSISKTINC